ncbi:hypothetical protein QVD17_20943 [Tagetes erecta]|uniref:E2F-associated phosphoprotein n=1 Tax=Tagetes erecta TaxID=13708 RepID=A0AAD8KMM5_TARER|nr:hypothetical protein QVD17_20943 [Tagetes erecta]
MFLIHSVEPIRPVRLQNIDLGKHSRLSGDFDNPPAASLTSSPMSQQKEDAHVNKSIDSEEKENSEDQIVDESVVSDDDVIDYSVKPEFYDPNLDDKDQLWVQKRKKGQYSDAVLSCPACFTTLCLECQRHEKYVTQYRAVFVVNCKIKKGQVSEKGSLKRKRVRKGGRGSMGGDESFSPVCCSVCETEVGVIDDEEIYHFYNVLPSMASGDVGSLRSDAYILALHCH